MAVSETSANEWEAAQWVGRRIGGQPFDEAGFDKWLAGDPRRQALFETMWQRIAGPGMDETLQAISRQRRSRRTLAAGGAAAVLVLFAGYQAMPMVGLLLATPQEYAAADGVIRHVALSDGTQVTLAGGTDIRVRYAWRAREIELRRGTIFADVVHDASRPLHIQAGKARISDIGTRFEVSKKPSFVRVTVESGAVRFATDEMFVRRIDLSAHQAAVLTTASFARIDDVGDDGVARWRTEWTEYHDTPLHQVVADLESVSPLPIRIASGDLVNLRVSGRIRLTDPMRQITNLSIIHDFSVSQQGGAIVLSGDK